MSHPYQGTSAALATKHGKENVLRDLFANIGVELQKIELDTDQLGTFSGEIPRSKDQLSTALAKARLGISASGFLLGLGSEGSIGADHQIPFMNSDLETLAWVDTRLGIEVIQNFRSFEIVAVREELTEPVISDEFLNRADFPNHALIVHGSGAHGSGAQIYKGIREFAELERAVEQTHSAVTDGVVIIESDLRAHMSPSRMANIRKCGELLVARLQRLCPECATPGFGEIAPLLGLPCETCHEVVVTALRGQISGCARCDFREEVLAEIKVAPARLCNSCNP